MRTPDLPHDVFLDIFDAAPVRDLTPGEVIISAGEPATHDRDVDLHGTHAISVLR